LLKYKGKEVEINDDEQIISFTRTGLESSTKKRGIVQRQVYADLENVIKNGIYVGYEKGDEKHPLIDRQNIYYSAIKISDKLFGVRFKIDIPKGVEKGNYKDHIIVEIEIEKSPLLYIGPRQSDVSYQQNSDLTITVPEIKQAFAGKGTTNIPENKTSQENNVQEPSQRVRRFNADTSKVKKGR
jgi:predicted GNAT family acetyltransferase